MMGGYHQVILPSDTNMIGNEGWDISYIYILHQCPYVGHRRKLCVTPKFVQTWYQLLVSMREDLKLKSNLSQAVFTTPDTRVIFCGSRCCLILPSALKPRKDNNLSCRECRGISPFLTSLPRLHPPIWGGSGSNLTITPFPYLLSAGCLWLLERRMDLATSNGWSHTTHSILRIFCSEFNWWRVNDCLFTLDVRQSYLRLFARRLQTFHLQSLHWTLHWVSFFMRGSDANLSQIINGVWRPGWFNHETWSFLRH